MSQAREPFHSGILESMSNISSSQAHRRWWRRALMASVLPAAFLVTMPLNAAGQTMKPKAADLNRVVAGVTAPAFSLPDAAGKMHTLASFRGTPTVLVFYRGYW